MMFCRTIVFCRSMFEMIDRKRGSRSSEAAVLKSIPLIGTNIADAMTALASRAEAAMSLGCEDAGSINC